MYGNRALRTETPYRQSLMEKDIDFIARRYREGRFAIEPALRRIRPAVRRWWSPVRIAAASIAVVVMGATAAILVRNAYHAELPEPTEQAPARQEVRTYRSVSVIDFEDTPLPVVVDRIRDVYGVEVVNLPENADSLMLSLHYEGSAPDLIETVNEILDIEMRIEE